MACWLGPGKEAAQRTVGHKRGIGRVLNPAPRYGVEFGRLGSQKVKIVFTIGEAVIGVAVRVRK
jgi:hypothetical protein